MYFKILSLFQSLSACLPACLFLCLSLFLSVCQSVSLCLGWTNCLTLTRSPLFKFKPFIRASNNKSTTCKLFLLSIVISPSKIAVHCTVHNVLNRTRYSRGIIPFNNHILIIIQHSIRVLPEVYGTPGTRRLKDRLIHARHKLLLGTKNAHDVIQAIQGSG